MQASQTILLRIGTRGSPLALAQARQVRALLAATHAKDGLTEDAIELRIIKTSGDRIQDRPLSEVGGKGLFTKEIEEAMLAGEVDLAVHSMKDVATRLPDGLGITSMLEREDVRDAFVSVRHASLGDLPHGATLGTSSLRRQAQVKRLRPDLAVVQFRGNVETRLRKLADGVAEATFLAAAGLRRLGLAAHATRLMAPEEMLPAVAQGAIGIETRLGDDRVARLVAPLDHRPTSRAVAAERAFLARLDGSCRTPIAALAGLDGGRIVLRGQVLSPDGSQCIDVERSGAEAEAERLGDDAGREVLTRAPASMLARGP